MFRVVALRIIRSMLALRFPAVGWHAKTMLHPPSRGEVFDSCARLLKGLGQVSLLVL